MACAYPSYSDSVVDSFGKLIPIPCGKCMQCRISIQRKYVDRMFCSYFTHSTSAFVTFTYDDSHLRIKEGFINPTLSKDDLHKYLDKIRHMIPSDVDYEYFVSGEYGDKFGRPHYHALFFGLDYELYKDFFERSWKLGSVKVLPCSVSSFRYVSKYVCKSYYKSDSEYYDYGIIPPFCKYSRGLGSSVFYQYKDDIEKNGFFVFKGRKIYCNRYYFNKMMYYTPKLLLYKQMQNYSYDNYLSSEGSKFGMTKEQFYIKSIENKEESLISKTLRENSKLV